MPANIGSQQITVKFFDPVDSAVANRIGVGVRKLGIYSGGYLTKISDTSVSLSVFDCEIGDATYQIRATTGAAVTITVGPSTPLVVLRWTYTGSAAVDYVDFVAVAVGAQLATDVVIGLCSFTGITLTGFDYTLRTNPNTMDLFLKVEPTVPASMYLRVRSGRANYGSANLDIVDQLSPLFTAPGSNSRIDLVQINSLGGIIVTQGVAAASPVPPNYGGLVTLAEVTIVNGQTTITSASIKDVRAFVNRVNNTSQVGFGVWVDGLADSTTYLAATDGFVCASSVRDDVIVRGYTDASNPPTTLRVYSGNVVGPDSNAGWAGITMPVRKGDYWRVTGATGGSAIVKWLPMGT